MSFLKDSLFLQMDFTIGEVKDGVFIPCCMCQDNTQSELVISMGQYPHMDSNGYCVQHIMMVPPLDIMYLMYRNEKAGHQRRNSINDMLDDLDFGFDDE